MNRIHSPLQQAAIELRVYPPVYVRETSAHDVHEAPRGLHEVKPNMVQSELSVGRQWLMDGWEPIEDWRID
ncbi:MAG: hypothetical protein Q8M20_08350 [Rhodocyclaceae bacterium]|nr:hypothetical protein [Rhodocyclaceae bacterium]MDZ4216482.1 hypothetical protein [Rhodocyclaceae bacterium]